MYFVSTESPKINIYRVFLRKSQGGHDVPPEKIVSRYYRSLELLYNSTQIAYQAYFFDNSVDNQPFSMFAHFKRNGVNKVWDKKIKNRVPTWFKKYYSDKVKIMKGK